MAVKIRLKRGGKKNAPSYRIVVADELCARDGRFIEEIGFYNPITKVEEVDLERVKYWKSVGAKPSATVARIVNRAEKGIKLAKPEVKGYVAPQSKKKEIVEEATEEVAETAEA
jgi:small subunit ribosomal protein S16